MSGIAVGYYSDRGTTHQTNQDSLMLKRLQLNGRELVLAGVFDGMGGLSEGERVSGAAAKEFALWADTNRELIFSGQRDAVCRSLCGTMDTLNDKIRAYAQRCGKEAGTTAVLLLLYRERYIVCNLGDSRAYKLTENGVERLSQDHSMVADLVRAGLLSEEGAAKHPQRNVLTQALGTLEKITPAFSFGSFCSGDAFLLCSDGLYDRAEPEELRALGETAPVSETLSGALRELTAAVISRGETDNISGILIKTVK